MRHLGPSLSRSLAASVLLACGDGATGPEPTEGSIEVTTATSGLPVLEGYAIVLDGEFERPIGSNGRAVFTPVTRGAHEVRLVGPPSRCAVAGANPRSVTVVTGVAHLHFDIDCRSAGGTLLVETATQGLRPDPNGYRLVVSGYPEQRIGPSSRVTLEDVPPGRVTVTLSDVATNCTPAAPNPRTVTVESGRTGSTRFEVSCAAAGEGGILFTSNRSGASHLYRVDADGTNLVELTPSTEACCGDWSPDGSRIVFSGPSGLMVMDQDGGDPTPLGIEGAEPRWSPDGTRLLFTSGATFSSDGTIHVANADGSSATALGSGRGPDWSPDGRRIAFWRKGSCILDICGANVYLMNADGTGVQRVTNSSGAGEFYGDPAWSPEGSRIAIRHRVFIGGNRLELMRPGGSDRVPLAGSEGPGRPVWSPDGSAIAFAAYGDNGGPAQLTVVPSTGGPPVVLASSPGAEYPESWK